jgi:hypothetical protein
VEANHPGCMSINFITNEQLYKQAIEPVARATSFVWIGTADIKDLHVQIVNEKIFVMTLFYN